MQPKENGSHVFRDAIEENRDGYRIVYHPADARCVLAKLDLFFGEERVDPDFVRKAMEKEFERILKRFPVPVKVSAMDEKRKLLRLSPNASDWHLMGYVRLWDSAVVRRWAVLGEGELPSEQQRPTYLANAYASIPFRVRREEREKARRKRWEKMAMAGRAVAWFLVGPAAIWAANGGKWTAISLVSICMGVGAYEGARIFGWRKPSSRERRREERRDLAEHYFFHCERNPEAFSRMVKENLEEEVAEERRKEEERGRESRRTAESERGWGFAGWMFRARGG